MLMGTASLSNSLVDRCLAGDAAAWRELHRTYYPQVIGFCKRMGVPPREAEDVAQDVFVQVSRYLGRFEQRADLRTWIYKLCISESGRWRRHKWWLFRPEARTPEPPVGLGWSDEATLRLVREALDAMNAKERLTFVLYEFEGLAGEEIARLTDAPLNTVWRRLHDARGRFKRHVEDPPLRPVAPAQEKLP